LIYSGSGCPHGLICGFDNS